METIIKKKSLTFNRVVGFITFLVVNAIVAVFLIKTLLNYYQPLSNWFFIMIVFVFFWLLSFIKKLLESFKVKKDFPSFKEFFIVLVVILISTTLTFSGSTYLNLDPVVSASLVSLTVGVLIKKYAPEATVGAFLGMSTFASIHTDLLLAVLFASVIDFGLKPYYKGYCGKLGAVSFTGGFLAFLILRKPFLATINYQSVEVVYLFLVTIVAAVITNLIKNGLKVGPIIAYSVVSLLGALIFNRFEYTKNLNFSILVFGASFIGMGSKEVHPTNKRVIITALVYSFILTMNLNFGCVGGRLGTITFMSLLISQAMYDVFGYNYYLVKKAANKYSLATSLKKYNKYRF